MVKKLMKKSEMNKLFQFILISENIDSFNETASIPSSQFEFTPSSQFSIITQKTCETFIITFMPMVAVFS